MRSNLKWIAPILRSRLVLVTLLAALVIAAPDAAAKQLTSAHPLTRGEDGTPNVCFSAIFSGPLPGKADYCLGMLDWSEGHYRNGLDLLMKSAGWGNKNAQYTLGLIHYSGHHVPANPVLGLAWFKLADERHNDDQISRVTRSAFKWATPAQRQEAGQLVKQMEGTYGDEVATARAWHRLRHWQSRNGAFDSGCVRLFGAQAAAARRLGLAGEPPQTIRTMLYPERPISTDGSPKSLRKARKLQRRYSNANAGVCVTIQMQQNLTHQLADKYFAGWMGVVTVGPLKQVPAPASSSGTR